MVRGTALAEYEVETQTQARGKLIASNAAPHRKMVEGHALPAVYPVQPGFKRNMATFSIYLGIYAGGCIVGMIFFLTGRWPAVLERGWRWPVIFLWPMVVLWPLYSLTKRSNKAHAVKISPANANRKIGGGV